MLGSPRRFSSENESCATARPSACGQPALRGGSRLSHTSHMDHLGQTILVLIADVISFTIFWLLELVVFNRSFRVHRFETA